MHDAKTVTFAQHFLKIGEPVTVRLRMALPLPSAESAFVLVLDAGTAKDFKLRHDLNALLTIQAAISA